MQLSCWYLNVSKSSLSDFQMGGHGFESHYAFFSLSFFLCAVYLKVQVHNHIFCAKDCMPCNRLCRNCSCYWSIFHRCLSLNKGLPLLYHRNLSTKTARRAKCGTETLLMGTQLKMLTVLIKLVFLVLHKIEISTLLLKSIPILVWPSCHEHVQYQKLNCHLDRVENMQRIETDHEKEKENK